MEEAIIRAFMGFSISFFLLAFMRGLLFIYTFEICPGFGFGFN